MLRFVLGNLSLTDQLHARDSIHNNIFPSQLTNGPKKLQWLTTLGYKFLPGTNTLAYRANHEGNEVLTMWSMIINS